MCGEMQPRFASVKLMGKSKAGSTDRGQSYSDVASSLAKAIVTQPGELTHLERGIEEKERKMAENRGDLITN